MIYDFLPRVFSPISSLSIKKPDSWYVDIEYSDMETAFTWVK